MTLVERIRTVRAPHPDMRRVPLRIKLVVSVLVLVFAALTLISAGSTLALHRYLIGRMDQHLSALAGTALAYCTRSEIAAITSGVHR